VPAASFTANGYNGTVLNASTSELQGEQAFVESSLGFLQGTFLTSVANLGSLGSGDNFRIRYVAAYDGNTSGAQPDWAIDNVIFTLTPVPEPTGIALAAIGMAGFTGYAWRRRRQRT
jgi:hypothetical protein